MSGNVPTDSAEEMPRHVAVVMDGNGRWARARGMPRHLGHRAGVKSVRAVVRRAGELGVGHLTLFAFSSENWRRPEKEVTGLMKLFLDALQREVAELHENSVRLRFVGDLKRLSTRLQAAMADAERLTAGNTGLNLNIAVGFGGRWDIVGATRRLAMDAARGEIQPEDIDEERLSQALALGDCPDVDLMIRTGGERRISNFLLWQCAYAELYFCDDLWPEFDASAFETALDWFGGRSRRFGRVARVAQEEAG